MLHRFAAAVLALACCAGRAAAQQTRLERQTPFTIAEVLAAPFASELASSPNGRAVAWLGAEEGRRNVWVAEAPAYRARNLTRYTSDDGQEVSELTWTADGRGLLYVRGGDKNAAGEIPNPTSSPRGAEQAVWLVALAGGPPRRVALGGGPAPAPTGDRVALLKDDTVWVAPLRGPAGTARILFRARGQSAEPQWSPDGRYLAFTSRRGDHSFAGVYDTRRDTIRYLAPSVDRDGFPRWSPDGKQVSFVRRPGQGSGSGFGPGGGGGAGGGSAVSTYGIWVADAATGEAHEAWHGPAGPEGAFPTVTGNWAPRWAAGGRIVFAAELGGWLGLYSVSSAGAGGGEGGGGAAGGAGGGGGAGGEAVRLTPQGCEVEQWALTADRAGVLYSSNCGDIDRRHVQRVAVAGGEPVPVTSGEAIEWNPQPLAGGGAAFLRADAAHPGAPFWVGSDSVEAQRVEGWREPTSFPAEQLVTPQQVVVRASDSLLIHLQLFVPRDLGPGRHPAILFFHGGSRRQMLLGWHYMYYYHNAYALNQYLASRGFIVASVNYRSGIGYGRSFREAPRVGRNGAAEYLDVLAAAAYLRGRPDVDSARVGLWGGSYGGYLTALGLARNSDLFAAGVDLHGVHDWADDLRIASQPRTSDSLIARMREASPVGAVDRWRSPVLLIQGDDDRNVQFAQMVDLVQRLRRRGVSVEQLVFPDEVHDFLRHAHWLAAYRAAVEFFATKLGTRVASAPSP